MLEITEVHDTAGMAALRAEWQGLLQDAADITPFQSLEWQLPWWRHHGQGKLWILLARDAGRLVGLMPLFISRYYGLPLRRVAFVGTRLSDYQDLIALPDRVEECRDAFLAHLHRHRDRWDLLDLHDLREGVALTRTGPLPNLGLWMHLFHHRLCPCAQLPETWDGYAATLGKNMRTNIGRRRRQLSRELQAECDTVTSVQELPQAMDDLFRLHTSRWRRRGVSGSFASSSTQRFHQEVAQGFLERGWLRLHRLRAEGQTRAASYCFHYGRTTIYYQGGFDPALFRYSAGMVLMGYAISQAIDGGARFFDFTRGTESYKYEWKGTDRRTFRLVVGKRRSLRSWLALLLNAVERRVEQIGLRVQRWMWGRQAQKTKKKTKQETKQETKKES